MIDKQPVQSECTYRGFDKFRLHSNSWKTWINYKHAIHGGGCSNYLPVKQSIKKQLRSKQLRLDHATKLSKAQGRLTLRRQVEEMRDVYTSDVNKLHAENQANHKEIEDYYSSQMCEKTKEMVEMRFNHWKECVKIMNAYEQKLFTKTCEIEELKEDLRHKANNVSELLGHVAFLEHSFKGE